MEEKLILNTNAYFYTYKNNNRKVTNTEINDIFEDVSINKIDKEYTFQVIQKSSVINSDIIYSICIFKYYSLPPFLECSDEEYNEIKFAYIIIIEYKNYIIINKRNISNLKRLYKLVEELDYYTISRLYVNNSTLFRKFSLKNMDFSDLALRNKTIEANNIRNSFSAFGANKYILSIMRVQNSNKLMSMTMSTSRINYIGEKNHLNEFFDWIIEVVKQIENFNRKDTYLDLFSTPLDFETNITNLFPISILFTPEKFIEDLENGVIKKVLFIKNEYEKEIKKDKYQRIIQDFSYFKELYKRNDKNYLIKTKYINRNFVLKRNKKSFTIGCKKLNNFYIDKGENSRISIVDYINRNHIFLLNFNIPDTIYFSRRLFKDHKLLDNIPYFLSIFQSDSIISQKTTEKGFINETSTCFDDNSLFSYVTKLYAKSEYLVCDDLGNEWADFISISNNNISFIHVKSKKEGMSATNFQDIVGQAIKNLGNFTPQRDRWTTKKNKWNMNYVNSKIKRIFIGDNCDNLIKSYNECMSYPNHEKEVVLIINFISKSYLTNCLNDLKGNNPFSEKNQTIQILWYISSLIACCSELNIKVKIICNE